MLPGELLCHHFAQTQIFPFKSLRDRSLLALEERRFEESIEEELGPNARTPRPGSPPLSWSVSALNRGQLVVRTVSHSSAAPDPCDLGTVVAVPAPRGLEPLVWVSM